MTGRSRFNSTNINSAVGEIAYDSYPVLPDQPKKDVKCGEPIESDQELIEPDQNGDTNLFTLLITQQAVDPTTY
jgi:hypothetical protein